jgi:hypothetical protein
MSKPLVNKGIQATQINKPRNISPHNTMQAFQESEKPTIDSEESFSQDIKYVPSALSRLLAAVYSL